jgi:hypothetical protein
VTMCRVRTISRKDCREHSALDRILRGHTLDISK